MPACLPSLHGPHCGRGACAYYIKRAAAAMSTAARAGKTCVERTGGSDLDSIRFVLVRPGSGGNIGAAARALKNMGRSSLWLVGARSFDAADAARLAHGATDVLREARRVDTLHEALDDCRWVVGTTRRIGRRRA